VLGEQKLNKGVLGMSYMFGGGQVWWRAGDNPLLKRGNAFWNRDPRALGLNPNMPVDLEPVRIIERPSSNGAQTGSQLSGVRDSCSAGRAETHFQPAAAFVRAMLALYELALKHFDRFLRKRGKNSKRACEPSLAESAVADRANGRLPMHNVPD